MGRNPKKPGQEAGKAPTRRDLLLVLSPGMALLVLLGLKIALVGLPSPDDMASFVLTGWIAVLSTTFVSTRWLEPGIQSSLAMTSLVSLASLLCVWFISAPVLLRDTSVMFFAFFSTLIGVSCGFTALWPRARPPPEPVEEEIPAPVGLGPAELEKIEKKVFDYVCEHRGSIERRKCLIDLGITEDLLMATLSSLEKSGKLKLKRGEL